MRLGWMQALVDLPPILDIVLKISALLVLGWVAHFALRRSNPRWRVVLWRGVILGVVALPILGAVLPELQLRVGSPTEPEPVLAPIQRGSVRVGFAASFGDDRFGWAPLPATGAEEPAVSNASSTSPPGIGVMEWVRAHYGYLLGCAWAVIAVVLILFAVKAHNRSRRIVRRSRPAPNWARAMLERIAADLKCRKNVALRCSAEVCSPLLTGIFKPSIILPQGMVEEDSAADVEGVLAHELAHLKWGDLVWSRLLQAISIILWFQPLVWRIRAAHASACEEACDAVAAQYVGDREVYSGTLARVALGLLAKRRALAGIPMARRPQIRRRLTMLKKKIWFSHLRRGWVLTFVLSGAVALATISGLKLTGAERDSASSSARISLEAPGREANRPGARVLHFPKDRSLGTLRVRDVGTNAELYYLFKERVYPDVEWEYLGAAMGDVIVPAGKLVRLVVPSNVRKDLSPLSKLRPDDLHMLVIHRPFSEDVRADETIMPHLARLTGLKVLLLYNTHVRHKGLAHISGLKSLKKLKIISASMTEPATRSQQVADAGLGEIAKLKSLEVLWLSGRFTDDGLHHLAGLTSLREMYLHSVNVRGPGLAHLAKLPSLRYLDFKGNNCGDAGPAHLKSARSLRKLVLGWSQITDAGLAHLSHLAELEELDLHKNPITNDGLTHLKSMRSLKELNLSGTQVTEGGLVHLKEIKSLESLTGLSVSDKGLADLSELSKLRCLRIGGTITDAGLRHLAELQSLEELELRGGGITDAGMSHIAKLTNLRDLKFYGCPITDEGLAKLRTLKSLRKLLLRVTNITISGLNHVNAMPHLTELTVYGLGKGGPSLDISRLTELRSLSLRSTSAVRDEDLVSIGKLGGLRHLQIRGPITDAGMTHLARLTSLHWLSVDTTNHLTDKALSHLANMKQLDDLRISTGDFTDKGLRYLEGLKALRFLYLTSENAFSRAALQRLWKNLPNLQSWRILP